MDVEEGGAADGLPLPDPADDVPAFDAVPSPPPRCACLAACGYRLHKHLGAPVESGPRQLVWVGVATLAIAPVVWITAFVVLLGLVHGAMPLPDDFIRDASVELLKCHNTVFGMYNTSSFISYGTLLGGVRHADFLPFDTPVDIDIALLKCDEERIHAMAPMFDTLCGAQLVHRSDFQPTVFNMGSWAIKKSAFRLYWRRFLPVYLDYQMYTVFSDKERAAITAGLEDAAQGLGGCRDLIPPEGDSEAFDKGGPRGTLVPDITGRERWVEARPDATYMMDVSEIASGQRFDRITRLLPEVDCPFLFRGVPAKCPRDIPYLMQQSYGKTWRTPIRNFKTQDTVASERAE